VDLPLGPGVIVEPLDQLGHPPADPHQDPQAAAAQRDDRQDGHEQRREPLRAAHQSRSPAMLNRPAVPPSSV
jgi:hypothetical protein